MDEALRAELLHRVEKDQVARKAHDADGMREADAGGVDARRAAAGLGTIAEYLTRFTEPPQPSRLKCPECNGQVPFEMPDDLSQPLTVTCPECGREMTLTFGR